MAASAARKGGPKTNRIGDFSKVFGQNRNTAEGDGSYAHGSTRESRAGRFQGPCGGGVGKTMYNVSLRVRQADEQGSPATDMKLVDLLANLINIIPGECAEEAAIEAARAWPTVEDQEDFDEAMRLDAVDEMTERVEGTGVGGVDFTDDEKKEDGDDERTGRGDTVLQPYAEFPRALASWGGQRRRTSMTTPPSTYRRPGWRSSKCMRPSQCGRQT
eukprot:jgi/Undpi1/4539/HiC_scaffold_18.g07893.m1